MISAFREKPEDPKGIPGSPDEAFVSMGNYMFSADVLEDILQADAASSGSSRDIGGDIIPGCPSQISKETDRFLRQPRVLVRRFLDDAFDL